MKITKRQLQEIIKEEKKKLLEADLSGDSDDLDYFQDQVEEAYARLAAESDDIEHLLPEHIIAKITKALNSIEGINTAISELRK